MDDDASFGNWVRLRRKTLDLTQSVLADRVGCAIVTIKKIEQDERRPSRQMAERIADVLAIVKSERDDFIKAALGEKSPIRLPKPTTGLVIAKTSKPIQYLPSYASSIIGRKKEINTTIHMLSHDNRLVTLTGPGGVGKTRLAVAIGWAGLSIFKDGVIFVELATQSDPALVEEKVAQEIGIIPVLDRTLSEQLVDFIFPRQLLIILDNFEHLLPAAKWVANLLTKASNLRILVTSRVELNLYMECLQPIYPLSLPKIKPRDIDQSELSRITRSDAVRLFLERARAHSPDFTITKKNAAKVARICNQLDGLPLAIELVASRVYQLSLDEISQRIEQRLDLASYGYSDLPLRQQTLRATFSWSYELLTPGEKELFIQLGIFSGGFTFDMSEEVCKIVLEKDFSKVLDGLVKHNLVFCQPDGRYGMLETVREYAFERLIESDYLEGTQKAHLNYFVRLMETAHHQLWAREDKWIPRLIIETSNIERALTWSLTREDAQREDVVKGGQIVGWIWYFWLLTGRLHLNQRWLDLAESQIQSSEPVLARLLLARGVSHWQQGDLSKSEKEIKNAIGLFYSLEDAPDLAESLHMQGHIIFDYQRYKDAEKLFLESMKLYDSLKDMELKAILINDLGLVAMHQNELEAAKNYYEKSLDLFEQLKMRGYTAQAFLRLGDLNRMLGNYHEAGDLYQKSLVINQESRSQLEIASNLHKLSFIALLAGDLFKTKALLDQSTIIQCESGNQQGIAECFAAIASFFVAMGEDIQAARFFGAARSILEQTGLPMSPVDLIKWQQDEQIVRGRSLPEQFDLEYSTGKSDRVEEMVNKFLAIKINLPLKKMVYPK